MKPRSWFILLWLAVFVAFSKKTQAAFMQWFDLDRSAGEAAAIYMGTLHRDGSFSATKVLKGPSQLPGRVEIEQGEHWSSTYAELMGVEGEPEIIAFVKDLPVAETSLKRAFSADFVAVSPASKIFGWFPALTHTRSKLRAHEFWTRDLFLSQLEQSLTAISQLNSLLAAQPSATRPDQLLSFIKNDFPRHRAHREANVPEEEYGRGTLFYRAAGGLRNPSEEEEFTLFEKLRADQPDEDLARLLAAIAAAHTSAVHPSTLLYSSILSHAASEKSGIVRREAFLALAALDPYAAAGDLAKFLQLDEPELRPVLLTLSNCAQSWEPRVLNAAVLEPLGKLGPLIMEESRGPYSHEKVNRKNFMLSVVDLYHHPSNLALLMGGADDAPLGPGRPTPSQFRTMTALGHNPEQGGQLPEWWEKNHALLQRPYDLRTTPGLEAWLKAFDGSDERWTKRMLLRFWDFEPVIPEAELLRACHGPNPNAAKALLAELWRKKRISGETRKTLVEAFVKMHIQDKRNRFPEITAWRELTVECDTDFPFPEHTSIAFAGELACGRVPVITDPRNGGSAFLASSKTRSLQSLGGTVEGSAKALIELYEMDYAANPPRELWRLRWKLDQDRNIPQSPVPSETK